MRRPLLVIVIGIVMIVTGISQVLAGALFMTVRDDREVLAESGATTAQITNLAVVLLVVGGLSIVLAVGLIRSSRLARGLIGVLELVQLAGGIWTVAVLDSSHRAAGIGSIVGALLVLYFLFGTEKARAFFAH